jgi:cytoskeletal protein CcmA (bactofilin family)
MFKKKELENTTMENSYGQETNLIIAETKLLGDLVTDHNIHIEGEVQGNITCKGKVTIGVAGRVKGNINCLTCEIFGKIDGEIKVDDLLTLKETSRIHGNIETLKLKIDEGSFFEGSCKMSSALPDMSNMSELEMNEE